MSAGIGALAIELRKRRVSAVELADRALDGLERLAPRLNALATLTRERALDEARRADRRLARGGAGPLVGVPYGAKDLIATARTPGALLERDADDPLAHDASAVARLFRAGGVLAAKLAVENAGGGWSKLATVELVGGDGRRVPVVQNGYGRNPWDPRRWSGGSSSGPAAAVGAGLLPYALGTETSGSIVGPAAFCGLTAIRPTFGVVSLRGVLPLSWTLDKIGVLAWTADDCALVLAAIAGRDPKDLASTGRGFRPLARAGAARRVRRIQLGFAEEDFEGVTFSAALREMARLVKTTSRAVVPAGAYDDMVDVVMSAEGCAQYAHLIESDRFESVVLPRQAAGLRAGLGITAREYFEVSRSRDLLRADFARIFESVDVLVAPAQVGTAPPLEQLDAPRPHSAEGAPSAGNLCLTAASNLAELPAVVVPCGLAPDRMPLGLQLVGPRFSEPLLVALAAAYQRSTDHHLLRPGPIAREAAE